MHISTRTSFAADDFSRSTAYTAVDRDHDFIRSPAAASILCGSFPHQVLDSDLHSISRFDSHAAARITQDSIPHQVLDSSPQIISNSIPARFVVPLPLLSHSDRVLTFTALHPGLGSSIDSFVTAGWHLNSFLEHRAQLQPILSRQFPAAYHAAASISEPWIQWSRAGLTSLLVMGTNTSPLPFNSSWLLPPPVELSPQPLNPIDLLYAALSLCSSYILFEGPPQLLSDNSLQLSWNALVRFFAKHGFKMVYSELLLHEVTGGLTSCARTFVIWQFDQEFSFQLPAWTPLRFQSHLEGSLPCERLQSLLDPLDSPALHFAVWRDPFSYVACNQELLPSGSVIVGYMSCMGEQSLSDQPVYSLLHIVPSTLSHFSDAGVLFLDERFEPPLIRSLTFSELWKLLELPFGILESLSATDLGCVRELALQTTPRSMVQPIACHISQHAEAFISMLLPRPTVIPFVCLPSSLHPSMILHIMILIRMPDLKVLIWGSSSSMTIGDYVCDTAAKKSSLSLANLWLCKLGLDSKFVLHVGGLELCGCSNTIISAALINESPDPLNTRWVEASSLECHVFAPAAALAKARFSSYTRSPDSALLLPLLDDVATAGKGPALSIKGPHLFSSLGSRPWRALLEKLYVTDRILQLELLQLSRLPTLSETESASLSAWADQVSFTPVDILPEKLQSAIPDLSKCPELMDLPFAPSGEGKLTPTEEIPIPQQRDPSPDFNPQTIADLYLPTAFGPRWTNWLGRLLRFLEALRDGNDELVRRIRPEPYVISQGMYVPGARGVVWDCTSLDGKPFIADFSTPLSTHRNLDYFNSRMAKSKDKAMLQQWNIGVMFEADLELQTVLMPHLFSLGYGYTSVEEELLRLGEFGWMTFHAMLPCTPFRCNPQGATPRKFEMRWRRTSEMGAPRYELFDQDGNVVLSLNAVAANSRLSNTPGAPPPRLPKEDKPSLREATSDLCVLLYIAQLLHQTVHLWTDDFKDYFNQFGLHPSELWKAGSMWLFANSGELSFVMERVVGFGLVLASNICQRFSHAITELLLLEMDAVDDPVTAAEAAESPTLARWLHHRRSLASHSKSSRQDRLYCFRIYTDDSLGFAVGTQRMCRMILTWVRLQIRLNIYMALPKKRQIGSSVTWTGALLIAFGIILIPEIKCARGQAKLQLCLSDTGIDVQTYRSLMGLLEHFVFICQFPRSSMHSLYDPITGAASMTAIAQLSSFNLHQLSLWCNRLLSGAGAPITVALDSRALPSQPGQIITWSTDGCRDLTSWSGIGGYSNGDFFVLGLTRQQAALAHISHIEYLACAVGILTFAPRYCHSLPQPKDLCVLIHTDARATAHVLQHDSAKAPAMRLIDSAIKASPEFQSLKHVMRIAHSDGLGLLMADAASRNKLALLASLARALGISLTQLSLPQSARDFIDSFFDSLGALRPQNLRSLTPCETHRGRSRSDIEEGDQVLSDDPAVGRMLVQFSPAPARGSFVRHTRGISSAVLSGSSFGMLPLADSSHSPMLDGLASSSLSNLYNLPSAAVVSCTPNFTTPVTFTLLDPSSLKRSLDGSSNFDSQTSPDGFYNMSASFRIDGAKRRENAPVRLPLDSLASGPSRHASYALTVLDALLDDQSPYAICRDNPAMLRLMVFSAYAAVESAGALSTHQGERSAWNKYWIPYCRMLNSSVWRPPADRNHPMDYEREAIVQANFVLFVIRNMSPRRSTDVAPRPVSAMKVLGHIRRILMQRDERIVSLSMARNMLKVAQDDLVRRYPGVNLAPIRKEPIPRTAQRAIITIADGTRLGAYTVKHGSLSWMSWQCLVATLASTGFRCHEISKPDPKDPFEPRAMRSSAFWLINGTLHRWPNPALLRTMKPGDKICLIPPGSKSDRWAMHWGALPIWLPWENDLLNACYWLSLVEEHFPVHPSEGLTTPLFRQDDGSFFKQSTLDSRLKYCLMLVSPATAGLYSMHSFRIWLACALLAVGASEPLIQALVRWQTLESLHIYARLNADSYGSWILKASKADISSIQAHNLPPMSDDHISDMLASFF